MGIYDRDYYKEGRRFDAWGAGRACTALLGLTVGLLIFQVLTREARAPGWFTETFEFRPDLVLQGEVWRILGGAFLPLVGSSGLPLLGFIFNLLILWYFGRVMEERYGSGEFAAFYIAAALLGTLLQLGVGAAGVAGVRPDQATACWSAAVTAVLVLFALHHPRETVWVMFVIPVPVWIVAAFQVLKDFSGAFSPGAAPFGAHLAAGALALAYYHFGFRLTGWLPGRPVVRLPQARRPKLRVYRGEEPAAPVPAPVSAAAAPAVDEALEAKVDALLEKVAQHGQGSLTNEEREVLFRASELYKRKRKSQ